MNDENQLERWISSYGTDVLKMCYVYLSDNALAQDAMQDTFLKVWRKMNTFRGQTEREAKAWILRIAVNTCWDYHCTAWMRRVSLEREIESIPEPVSPISQPSRELFLAVMALPPKLKQPVWLYHYEGMNQAECAALLEDAGLYGILPPADGLTEQQVMEKATQITGRQSLKAYYAYSTLVREEEVLPALGQQVWLIQLQDGQTVLLDKAGSLLSFQ